MILDSFRQDVRVGLRMLFKEKAFCFLAVLVLALGICGATTQFTVVNAIVLRGFSFPHPEQLVGIGLIDPKATDQVNNFGTGNIPTAQDYEDIKAAQKSFSMMAGYLSGSTINVTYKNTPQRYTGGYVTEDMFKIVGVAPVMGRDFTAEDNKPGSEKTVMLGDEIWRRDFGADPNVVGQSVRVRSKPATMLAAVILVLLIACVNVMNMQFGRAALRAKELAIRGALGATRWRLVRQMLTESFVVALFGTIVGVLLAYWSVDLLARAVKAAPFAPSYW